MTDSSVNGAENLSVQTSPSYTDHGAIVQTDSGNQSVRTSVTHGTQGTTHTAPNSGNAPSITISNIASGSSNPSSPHRGNATTPLSMSPASTAGRSQVHPEVLGKLDPMPQYGHHHPHQQPQPQPRQQQQRQPRSQQQQRQPAHPQHGDVFLLQHHPQQHQQQQQQTTYPQQQPTHLHQTYPTHRDRSNPVSEMDTDDLTEPSTSANTGGGETSGYTRSDAGATSTFGRLIQSATKTMNNNDRNSNTRTNTTSGGRNRKPSVDEEGVVEGALIYGYLQKLGRNGKWQTRWFETDGECLTYYKSSKRSKLLATLDLAKVGSIIINSRDEKECCFIINISERPYHLRADSPAACKDWVITLNRVKEARMHEGNVKLVMPSEMRQPPDLLDQDLTPRVVVVANRQRTHAVEDDDIASWEAIGGIKENRNPNKYTVAPPTSARLARWQKPKTSIARIASKLLAWARSIRKHGCDQADNHVVLDHHLHPPGHDDLPSVTRGSYPTHIHGGVHGQPHSTGSVSTDHSPNTWIQNQNSTDKSFPREVVTIDLLGTDTTNTMNRPVASTNVAGDDDGARYLS
ncbi:PH domain containing protein [Nitzschia inconspicua]|uniref:PH domain containing protein n=1 Tax=Nitzschia inconspicua TaxID=303405 RepID=A0A9K3LD54_9STRA|nr:PH domain containing protein [Nitzschia inconspicua]